MIFVLSIIRSHCCGISHWAPQSTWQSVVDQLTLFLSYSLQLMNAVFCQFRPRLNSDGVQHSFLAFSFIYSISYILPKSQMKSPIVGCLHWQWTAIRYRTVSTVQIDNYCHIQHKRNTAGNLNGSFLLQRSLIMYSWAYKSRDDDISSTAVVTASLPRWRLFGRVWSVRLWVAVGAVSRQTRFSLTDSKRQRRFVSLDGDPDMHAVMHGIPCQKLTAV